MASKAALEKSEQRPAKSEPNALAHVSGSAMDRWQKFTHFLEDVRSEMRKVVAPSRKEVESTTAVVIIAVFIFAFYFWVVDNVLRIGIDKLLHQFGGF